MPLDNEAVCRLCDKHTTDLVSIFAKNAAGQQILHLVRKCFPIIIYRSDPLSKFICADCSDNIYNFYTFKQLVDNVITQHKFKLEQKKQCRSTLLYLNSLQENDDNGESSTGVPRSDRSTSTEDFYPSKSVDVDSLLDIECTSNTDNDITTNGNKEDTNNENENDQSNMETEEQNTCINSTIKSMKRIATRTHSDDPPCKRRRLIVGPKSAKESVADADLISDDPAVKYYRRIYYEPHSLMQSCLNLFNSTNVPDYYYEQCKKIVETVEEMQNFCNDCETEFETELEFVKHLNCRQLQLTLHRVDDLVYWPATNRDNYVRNLWLQSENPDTDIPEPEDDLLVPLADVNHHHHTLHHRHPQQPQYRPLAAMGGSINEITYVGDKVYINGVPLAQVGKKDRLYLYQTIRIQNIQRKFCTECRFMFKDNWAMDKHYTTLACLYTCRYCGRRFNSMRQVFNNHVQMHVDSGHSKSEKIFASNRRNDPNPRIINPATVRFLSPQQVVSKRGNKYQKSLNHLHKVFEQRASIRPVKLQSLLRDAADYDEDVRVKAEQSTEDRDKGNTPNSQAYFCKKCYKVFFKLDEYNAHTATVCLGGGSDGGDPPIVTVAGNVSKRAYQKQPKITPAEVARKIVAEQVGDADTAETAAIAQGVLSPTGRPVRHCVREVRTYNDDVERIEVQTSANCGTVGRFSCGICASIFPNVHSRNSHMRIHKTGQFKQQHGTSAASFAAAIANSTSTGGGGGGVVMGGPPPLKAGPSVLQQMQRQKQMLVQQQYGTSGGGGNDGGNGGGGLAQKIVNSLRQQKQAHQQAQFQQAVQLQRARQRQMEANYQQNMSKGRNQQHHNIGSAQRPVLHRPKLIKEEPIEPLVEIHEDEEAEEEDDDDDDDATDEGLEMAQVRVREQKYPRSVGSVSITPIAVSATRQRQRGNQQQQQQQQPVRSDIMRLVQNNPHLSIKPKAGTSSTNPGQSSGSSATGRAGGSTSAVATLSATMNNGGTPRRQYGTGPHAMRTLQRAAAQQHAHAQAQMQMQQQLMQQHQQMAPGDGGSPPDGDKIYRCSSCNVPFQNKSHLYFHKKNQCGGSKYPCPFCKKRFGTEAAYSSHIFYSHPI